MQEKQSDDKLIKASSLQFQAVCVSNLHKASKKLLINMYKADNSVFKISMSIDRASGWKWMTRSILWTA